MERLLKNLFPIQRMNPQNDSLPFKLDEKIILKFTSTSLWKSSRSRQAIHCGLFLPSQIFRDKRSFQSSMHRLLLHWPSFRRCYTIGHQNQALAHFPFAEDAGAVLDSLREFATSFVDAYYSDESLVMQDQELQAWVSEASGPAKVIDFPASPLTHKKTLIDMLTHLAYLIGVSHHTLNSRSLAASSGFLPFHPMALYQPIPEAKGVQSVLPFLPNLNASLWQVQLTVSFIWPQLFDSQGDLKSIFKGSEFLSDVPASVKKAASKLKYRLTSMSNDIRARSYNEKGLAQGMRFVRRNLDPRKIPFFLSV